MLTLLALTAVIAGANPNTSTTAATSRSGPLEATTSNFTVYSFSTGPDASKVAEQCERLRLETVEKWLGDDSATCWKPHCKIVLHPNRSSYANAVGRAAARTNGSSLIDFSHGQVSVRRIDLLSERQSPELSALPHELTHVMLADRFGDCPCPAWADEGVATLADSAQKQSLHKRDLLNALNRGQVMPLAMLLSSDQYPSGGQWAAFYGQSTSIVRMLSERHGPEQFIRFVELARENGYDAALRQIYDIDGIAELDRLWREQAHAEPGDGLIAGTAD